MTNVILTIILIMIAIGTFILFLSLAFSDTQTYEAIDQKIAQLIKGEGGADDE